MSELSDLLRLLLAKRGLEQDDAIAAFLSPDYEAHTHDAFLLNDMQKAADRILDAVGRNEHLAVYSDFDCDGIPAAALLTDFFNKISYTHFEVYIPHRDREGYGFHKDAVDILAKKGVTLIITADLGITAVETVAHANEFGIDVIVTDHHEIVGALPQAYAVVNPKLNKYPFPDLCGAAVAFKLVQAVLAEGKKRGIPEFVAIPEGWEKWLLDLVGIATVADMVPLIGENRVLAYWGLRVLRKSQRPGINALCTALKIKKSELSEDDIGFSIGPRINAASRMDDPDLAYRLLCTQDRDEAETLAAQLEHLNAQRKGVVAGIVKHVRAGVKARFDESYKVVVLGNTEWKPSLLGLAANSVVEDRGGMVCLWGKDASGKLKGSCRSDGTVSIAEVFSHSGDLFEACGGHDGSGGFTVSHERVHSLTEDLAKIVEQLELRDETISREHDADLSVADAQWKLYSELALLSPFGVGNPKPRFLFANTLISAVKPFGKEKNHIELLLSHDRGTMRAFQFFKKAEDFTVCPEPGMYATVIATIERDTFRGPMKLALRVQDVIQ